MPRVLFFLQIVAQIYRKSISLRQMKNFAFALLHPSRAAHVAHRCAVHQLVARGKFKIVRWQFSFFLKNRFHWGNIAEAHVALARDVLKLHLACSRENAHARASEFSLFFFLSFFLIFFFFYRTRHRCIPTANRFLNRTFL